MSNENIKETTEQVLSTEAISEKVDVVDKLNDSLVRMIEGIEDGAVFLSGEIPEFVNQLLMWHLVKNGLMAIFGLIFIGLSIYTSHLCLKFFKKAKSDYEESKEWTIYESHPEVTSGLYDIHGSVIIIPLVLFIMGILMTNLEWLQIWIAPKVWLVEYITTLVK